MLTYALRRLLLIVPTLFGIMVVNFIIVQSAPGGPVEQALAKIKGHNVEATARVSGTDGGEVGNNRNPELRTVTSQLSKYRGAQGLDPKFIKEIEQQFGFDKPAHERFFLMMKNYL